MNIEVQNVSYAYKTNLVLNNACFDANSGEIICLLGRNGAGKSTLFRCILGLLRGYKGQISIDGKSTRKMSRAELSRNIAYIPQSSDPVFDFSVFDAVLMGRTAYLSRGGMPGQADEEIVFDALARLGIEHLATCGYASISGGERQMAMIARALVQKSKIMIMDEPTANLDVANQFLVMEQIRRLREENYIVILSTHNPQQALTYADRVLALKDGKIVFEGPTCDVITEETLHTLYGIDFEILTAQTDGGNVHRVCIPKQTDGGSVQKQTDGESVQRVCIPKGKYQLETAENNLKEGKI